MPRFSCLFLLLFLPLLLLADNVSGSPAAQLIEQGDALKGKSEFEAAMAKYQEAVSKDPASAPALFKLGGMQLVQQQYAAAIDSFQRSLTLDPGNANAFVGMAVAYLHAGSFELAEAHWMRRWTRSEQEGQSR